MPVQDRPPDLFKTNDVWNAALSVWKYCISTFDF